MASTVTSKPIISADSHIMEPPNTYLAHIDKKYKDTAPKVVWDENRGDTYVIDGMKDTIPMGLVAAAGKKAEELAGLSARAKFEELHRGGNVTGGRWNCQSREETSAAKIEGNDTLAGSTDPVPNPEAVSGVARRMRPARCRFCWARRHSCAREAAGASGRGAARP